MKYRIVFQRAAKKFLEKQDRKTQERLLYAINRLPDGTDIKKLQGRDMYRLRAGSMRVMYRVDEAVKIITIENIDHRGDVYKE